MNPPRFGELTAVFGGRFDPPHLGHREAVRGLFTEPGVKRVVILPTGNPVHKPTLASAKQRFEMVKRAFQGIPNTEVSRLELDRSGPTYTSDSLPLLTQRYGPLAFVIGTDQLAELHLWHRFPEVLGMTHWIVLSRKNQPSDVTERALTKLAAQSAIRRFSPREAITPFGTFMLFQETAAPGISSTQVREKLARSADGANELVDPEVLSYLKMHRIYGS